AEWRRGWIRKRDRPIFDAMVWAVGDVEGLAHDVAEMPPVPPPSALASIEDLVAPEDLQQRHRFWANLESRPIDFVPWRERVPGAPVWREWYRYRPRATCDDPFADAARALLLIDPMTWPAGSRAHPRECGYIAPSLDLTAQFHRLVPESEWLLADAVAPIAAHGLVGAQARVW